MKKFKFILLLIFVLFTISAPVYAQDGNDIENEVQPNTEVEHDEIKEKIESYIDKFLTYTVGVLGTITGLLMILFRIKKIMREVKEGTKSIEDSKKELQIEKENFMAQVQQLKLYHEELKKELLTVVDVRDTLIESKTSQTSINETNKNIKEVLDKLIYCFTEICSNDSQLVSSGVAKNIKEVLEGVGNNV